MGQLGFRNGSVKDDDEVVTRNSLQTLTLLIKPTLNVAFLLFPAKNILTTPRVRTSMECSLIRRSKRNFYTSHLSYLSVVENPLLISGLHSFAKVIRRFLFSGFPMSSCCHMRPKKAVLTVDMGIRWYVVGMECHLA
ncbi:hypothetical protein D918_04321 [Trichuris suis]|nr:hypothetical protein D918_04321 [Trichuris suis]